MRCCVRCCLRSGFPRGASFIPRVVVGRFDRLHDKVRSNSLKDNVETEDYSKLLYVCLLLSVDLEGGPAVAGVGEIVVLAISQPGCHRL